MRISLLRHHRLYRFQVLGGMHAQKLVLRDLGSIEAPDEIGKPGSYKPVFNHGQSAGALRVPFTGIVCLAIRVTDVCSAQWRRLFLKVLSF